MNGTPKISVVMPVYNAEAYLREAIDSVLAQTYTDFECILIDDGSSDRSLEIIRSYEDPRIVLLVNETNRGQIASMNRAIEAARGAYIARMDSDDICLPERFALQVEYLERHPEIAGVGGQIIIIGERGETLDLTAPKRSTRPVIVAFDMFHHCSVAHPAMMLRREVLLELGGYREAYRYAEDYDLWHRLLLRWKLANLSETVLQYRRNTQGVTRTHNDRMTQCSIDIIVESYIRLTGDTMPRRTGEGMRGSAPPQTREEVQDYIRCNLTLVATLKQTYHCRFGDAYALTRNAIGRMMQKIYRANKMSRQYKIMLLIKMWLAHPIAGSSAIIEHFVNRCRMMKSR